MSDFIELWDRTPTPLISQETSFQALTWKSYDYEEQFVITCCGCLENGKSLAVTITDFKPAFFVKIPENKRKSWSARHNKAFHDTIAKKLYNKANQLISVKPIKAKVLYPFTNQTNYDFVKLSFSTHAAFKSASYIFKKYINGNILINGKYDPYETNIDPMLRFCHSKHINMAGWINVKTFNNTPHFSCCSRNISTHFNNIEAINDKQATAPFILASFDIECDSKATRDKHKHIYDPNANIEDKKKLTTIFPDASKIGDEIKIICTSLWKYGTDKYLKHAICVSPWGEIPNTGADICQCVKNEKELLIGWFAFIKKYDPDVMMGWNIYGFDDQYIYTRLEHHSLLHLMENSGRIKQIEGSMVDAKLVSSAYGTNFFKIMDMPGIYKVDLYVWFKKETKLESYKLDRVSEKYLGENKIDLIPLDLFFKMNIDSPSLSECVKYCVQDTLLPLRLTKARMIFINLIGMANITRVPIEWLIIRGQQIKVFSQITYETRLANVLVPSWDKDKLSSDEKFLGATVLHANKGAYFEAVSGLDFASLYPSIMIAYNLCYSTMVQPEDVDKYKDDPNIQLENITWDQFDEPSQQYTKQSYWYVQNIQGILPRILDKLWKQRKAVKKLMKLAAKNNDEELEGIYNAEQLAIKVSMNSVYGFTGATTGFLPMKSIASSVTAKGRQLIEITKNHCEENFECEVVYGDTDSCYVKFVARRSDNTIIKPEETGYMEEIFRLSELATTSCNKNLYKKPVDLEFEKVMYPFFLFTKKRYAYLEWTNTTEPNHLEAKGIHLVRRDVCPYVQNISKTVLNTMFYERNVKKAVEQAQLAVGKLITNRVDVNELKLSKTLKVGYKCSKCHTTENEHGFCICPSKIPTINLPHVQLAKRLKEQNSIDPPQPGERVPYVFIEGVGLQHERIEHPDLINDSVKPDGLYYLEHQLKTPLETLFELVLTPENGWDNGTSSLFENGAYADTIKLLKDSSKEREQQHKLNQRIKLTAKFKTNDKISRKISATESVNGTVTSVDYENGRVAILLDNSKKCNIFPDSLTLLN